MIYLFTDFGYNGPYVGQVKSVLAVNAGTIPVIDLMHDAPTFNPKAGAILLSSLVNYLPERSITLAVVDPGVGNPARKPIMLEADGRWFVGPDNGLFHYVIEAATNVSCFELRVTQPVSKTFHGRDIFAPAAAQLVQGKFPDAVKLDNGRLYRFESKSPVFEIIYIDHYGNAMTGLTEKDMQKYQYIYLDGIEVLQADTFSSVDKGKLFWYFNSIGLVEISVNCGSAAEMCNLHIGKQITLA